MDGESLSEREERIRGYLLEEFSEEPYGENEVAGSDHDEEDHVSESEHNSATDYTDSAADDTDRDPDYEPSDDERDEGVIERAISKIVERKRARLDERNSVDKIIEEVIQGNFGETINVQLMIDDEITEIIVTNTNIYIDMVSDKFARDRDAKKTDSTEIKSVLGLLILAGMMRSGHQNLEDLWSRDGFGVEIFYTTMTLKRFLFLLQCMRFDSLFDRGARRQLDKLAPFRQVFERFVRNCNRHFTVSTCTTIDEQLVPFRGRCSFRQFMKSKPAKYGLKIFTLTDAKLFYVKNMEVYVGTQPDDSPYKQSNKPKDVVLRLATPILDSGRNITADNWFSSIPLATDLHQRNISYVGTLRKDKRELPPELVEKKREANDSIFAFQDNITLVSYAPKKNRSVVLVSTMHHDSSIDESTGEKRKPEIVTFYNSTKSGVDVVDEKCGTYTTSRRCQRWPLVLFYRILDIGGINAQVIYTFNNFGSSQKMIRRGFLKEIGLSLVKPQITKRANVECLPRQLKASVSRIADNQQDIRQEPAQANARVRCTVCPRKKDVKTKYRCEKCYIPMCKGHLKLVCEQCVVGLVNEEVLD